MISVVVLRVISSLYFNVIISCAYDTVDDLSCLSQNQQLFCSAFVKEHVVFFATGIWSE